MIEISVTLPVNDPTRAGEHPLDRRQLWDGLLQKAEYAVPYVADISECTVLERTGAGLVRDVVMRGERIREVVTFEDGWRVSFRRADERATWVIRNDIGEDEGGALTLTFSAEMQFHGGQAPDVEQLRATTERGVQNTLDVIRRHYAPAA
ncbi:SRPBCC family protein [Streptomyces mashuensis]|uniref:SRPBCC family protein n=1 Tax=Streptomyces mashuensis TaxID=33904 RepID=UPI00167E043C|nr:SRPBCC family protein [Streptomyces mashuensis]